MENKKTKLQIFFGLIFILGLTALSVWGGISFLTWFTSLFTSLKPELIATLVTAFTTITVAAMTIASGRYFERLKETEAHFRTPKIEMYDEFLQNVFALFYEDKSKEKNVDKVEKDLVPFLREWNRKLVLWGGSDVLVAYIKWKDHLGKCQPDAQTVFLMDDLFRAMREDVGLSNKNLGKGVFSHMILRNASLFLKQAGLNPNITLTELSEIEKKLNLE
jgi:hypothetical protein